MLLLGSPHVATFGGPGAGPGKFGIPAGIAIDETGDVYVCDYTQDRVEHFDRDGAYLGSWGSTGTGDGQFRYPVGVAAIAGSVFVTDVLNGRVEKFTSSGVFTSVVCDALSSPFGIAANGLGEVYVTETAAARVTVFTDATTPVRRISWGHLRVIYR